MSHVAPPLLLGGISTSGYLRQIECKTIGMNAKQQDLRFTVRLFCLCNFKKALKVLNSMRMMLKDCRLRWLEMGCC